MLIGFGDLLTLLQCLLDEVLVQFQFIVVCTGHIGIQDDTFLYHLFLDNHFARNVYGIVALGLWGSTDTDFYFGFDAFQNFLRLVCRFRPKQVFFVYHYNNRCTLFLLGATGDFVKRPVLFAVTHHYIVIAIDACPVHEQDFARMDGSLGVVQLIVHHGTKLARFGEVVLHLEVTLFVQLVGSNPNESHLLRRQVTTALKLFGYYTQHFTDHHGLAGTGRSFEYQLMAVTAQSQQVDGLLYQFLYRFLLIVYLFHSAPPSVVSSLASSISLSFALGNTSLYAL